MGRATVLVRVPAILGKGSGLAGPKRNARILMQGETRMSQPLQRAFSKAAELPQAEQDRFARFLLAELESERQWAELFARPESEDLLERFAKEALSEHHAGRTQPLKAEDL